MKTSRIHPLNLSNDRKVEKFITSIPSPKYYLYNIFRPDDFHYNSFSHDKYRNDIGINVNNFATQNSIFKDIDVVEMHYKALSKRISFLQSEELKNQKKIEEIKKKTEEIKKMNQEKELNQNQNNISVEKPSEIENNRNKIKYLREVGKLRQGRIRVISLLRKKREAEKTKKELQQLKNKRKVDLENEEAYNKLIKHTMKTNQHSLYYNIFNKGISAKVNICYPNIHHRPNKNSLEEKILLLNKSKNINVKIFQNLKINKEQDKLNLLKYKLNPFLQSTLNTPCKKYYNYHSKFYPSDLFVKGESSF